MKKININTYLKIVGLVLISVLAISCEEFLDTAPDNRAEVDTKEKITSLLVSAYSNYNPAMMTEMSTDNVMDNGSNFRVDYKEQEEAYFWRQITEQRGDCPKSIWDGYYKAIASANQALSAIEEMGNPDELKAQRGEALITRAFNHFTLLNVFSLHYNPQTSAQDMGIPYSEEPETVPVVKYGRGAVAQAYEKINKDIEEALPLIDDNIYSVPKYHFNRKAAYAFAARFNLYYLKYDKVIEYASIALGENPASLLRNMQLYAPLGADDIQNKYVQDSEPANFLILPAYSVWGRISANSYGRRYAHNRVITANETYWAMGPWGTSGSSGLLISKLYGVNEQVRFPNFDEFWEYTDKAAGIGYPHTVWVAFTADETILCRAEAYAMKGEYDKAASDLNLWQNSKCKTGVPTLTKDRINTFFSSIDYKPIKITADNQRTIKYKLNPLGFKVAEGDQENFIHCVLHFRRLETIRSGLRWFDIKRYGIEIAHNHEGKEDDVLLLDDPRRALQLPLEVISAGLPANPHQ
ncbi:MAG: RagB/SusD family nutrient uptake outer membrane protein [Bacteroidia bacterium]|nr:RagB/SusD family nutrient uptake outer membrane protein [Bacteroidia bacterium]